MLDLTPTTCKANDLWIRNQLTKAERYHELTRSDSVANRQPVEQRTVQAPRISLIGRLIHALPRPA